MEKFLSPIHYLWRQKNNEVKELKVVHISTFYSGGAGTAAYRIHEALLEKGFHSSFLSLHIPTDLAAKNCYQLSKPIRSVARRAFDKCIRIAGNRFKLNLTKAIYCKNRLKEIRPSLHAEWTSVPFSEYNILDHPAVTEADVIHLHWVSEMLDYPSFFKNNLKPIVWTLHDMNPFQGIFHYKEDQLRNAEIAGDLDARIYSIKEQLIKERKCAMALVTPSEWLGKIAARSGIFSNIPVTCIRNPIKIPTSVIGNNTMLKKELGISECNTVFLFIAQAVENYRKGVDLLLEAFKLLEIKETTLIIIGDLYELPAGGANIINIGSISDKKALEEYFALADAVIIPSREDNLPNVMLEAMAFGTPVLAFNIGGLSEILEDTFNGCKASEINAYSLKSTIERFIRNKSRFNGEAIRNYVGQNFSYSLVGEEYINVYKKCMD